MKMAQVEFVATFAALFHAAKCEFVGADSKENTRALEALMKDSFLKLSLQMKEPGEVQLRWISQGNE
jgi:hypothetical protein